MEDVLFLGLQSLLKAQDMTHKRKTIRGLIDKNRKNPWGGKTELEQEWLNQKTL